MKKETALKYLSELPDDMEIILAWWEPDMFGMNRGEKWNEAVQAVEAEMEWDKTQERIQDIIEQN